MNTTKKLMALVLAALACMSANAQDHGRENGLGIRLTGEMTSKIDVNDHLLRSEVFGDTAYLFFPTTGFKSVQLSAFYKAFFYQTQAFVEAQLGGYYMGQKESDLMFFPGPGYTIEYHVVNIDMDEWGASASLVAGYNFPIKNSSSVDVFTGPEVRGAISCKNQADQDLLKWHFYRWQTRWKLGVGYNFKHVGAQVSGSYDLTEKAKQMKSREFTFSLSLGYKF